MLERIDKSFVQGVLALALVGFCLVYCTVMQIKPDVTTVGFIGTIVGYYFGKEK